MTMPVERTIARVVHAGDRACREDYCPARVVHADDHACRDDLLLTELSMLMTMPVQRTVSRVVHAYDHLPDCVDRITLVACTNDQARQCSGAAGCV